MTEQSKYIKDMIKYHSCSNLVNTNEKLKNKIRFWSNELKIHKEILLHVAKKWGVELFIGEVATGGNGQLLSDYFEVNIKKDAHNENFALFWNDYIKQSIEGESDARCVSIKP